MRRIGNLTVYEGVGEYPPERRPSVVTIGVFDGVHLGHRSLMRSVVDQARNRGAAPVVVTFDRHPMEVIAPEKAPKLIMTLPQRVREMEDLGIEAVVLLRFDELLRMKTPEEFVREILVDHLGCIQVVVGANFRFGFKQAGTIETLSDLGASYGFGVTIFALVGGIDDNLSSTLIRKHIAEGAVDDAATELGRPYSLEGTVEHGAGRGRQLGYPTANLRVPARLILPKLGVYAGWLHRRGERHPAVANVGLNPTFEDRATPIVEVYVLDFDEDLYGEVVQMEFTRRLRDELKFASVEELVEQIDRDVEDARRVLGVEADRA